MHGEYYVIVWVAASDVGLNLVLVQSAAEHGCMENPERRNNPDQLEQTNFCECDHVQATESLIPSLL